MTQSPSPQRPYPPQPKQDDVDLGKLFFLMLSNWHWFAMAIVVAMLMAWLYIKYTLPTWNVSATVLIEEDKKSSGIMGTDKILEGFGLRPGMQNLDNQLLILTSWSTIEKTLDQLNFDKEYYYRGRINKSALYPNSPIKVIIDSTGLVPLDVEYKFRLIDDNTFSLKSVGRQTFDLDIKAAFGDTINVNGGKMRIERMEGGFKDDEDRPLYFVIHSRDKLVESYRERLVAKPASKEGTIVNVSLEGTNKQMDIDFLNKLVEIFLNNNLEKKNKEAVRTINFIDEQLAGISDSLTLTEDKLQKFRSENRVMDMSAQGQQIIAQAMTLENERARLMIESNYYDYLSDYLSKESARELPVSPATMGITDPALTKLVIELADLQSQYYSRNFTDKNPLQTQIAQKLRNTRDALIETLKGVKQANELAKRENREQIRSVNASAATLPKTERELLGIERKFKLNDVLYSFLIEKKAEAQIQKASNTPDNEIVDKPRPAKYAVAPSPMKTYLFAVFASLGLPFITILFLKSINNIVKDEEDLKKITDLPIAGHIPHGEFGTLMVLNDPSSNIAEAFRSLRARIQFFTREKKSPVILVTSSMPEEGKTFTAINLASIYSIMGKKTILVGLDLRKPKIYGDFNIPNDKGISTWLIGRDILDDVIVSSSHKNLEILPAGPIPPNPSELIMSEKTVQLIQELKSRYEYIIIDSAPVGTVADSMTLAGLSDATIMLVRHGKTIAPLLSNTLDGIKANGINGMSLLVNDIKFEKRNYGYYTKYGYSYRYELSKNKF